MYGQSQGRFIYALLLPIALFEGAGLLWLTKWIPAPRRVLWLTLFFACYATVFVTSVMVRLHRPGLLHAVRSVAEGS